MAIIYGRAIGGGSVATMSLFGDGSNGDLILPSTQTYSQPISYTRSSIEEKQYKSISIDTGATYAVSDLSKDLVWRVQGDCTINGTIDLSATQPSQNGGNLSIFVGGDLTINGSIRCNGADADGSTDADGGNGGSIYIVYNGAIHNNGEITVNGGLPKGTGTAGAIGTVTILSYNEYMQDQTA